MIEWVERLSESFVPATSKKKMHCKRLIKLFSQLRGVRPKIGNLRSAIPPKMFKIVPVN